MYSLDKQRPLSWSSLSSFWWNPEEWFQKYVLNYEQTTTKEMEFGKRFGEEGYRSVPELANLLTGKKEHPFKVMFGKIPLVGYADDFDDKTFKNLHEVKTGKKPWDQKRVDGHGQIDTYLLMNYITNKIRPEDVKCRLHWVPTQENGDFSISFVQPIKVHTFITKRTMKQILAFGMKINKTYKEMEDFVTNHE